MLNRSIAQAWTRTLAHLWHWHCSVSSEPDYTGINRHTQAHRHTDAGTQENNNAQDGWKLYAAASCVVADVGKNWKSFVNPPLPNCTILQPFCLNVASNEDQDEDTRSHQNWYKIYNFRTIFKFFDTVCDQHYFSMTNKHSCSWTQGKSPSIIGGAKKQIFSTL